MSRIEQKLLTRQRILEAAGRGFRRGGFGGVGVDGLAKDAGVTSGAFYVHFGTKTEAFKEAVTQGLRELKEGVLHYQLTHGRDWWPEFVRFYLGLKRTCDLSDSCALQSLSPEVARADGALREDFEAGLRSVARVIVSGPASPHVPRTVESACTALATLVGTVTLARAVHSPEFAAQIAQSAERVMLGTK